MTRSTFVLLALFAAYGLPGQQPTANAGITWSGNVYPDDPSDPTKWTSSVVGYVGITADGTLNITGGGTVNSFQGCLGDQSGSRGTVTIGGSSSTWTSKSTLWIGNAGIGTLNIMGGGFFNTEGFNTYSRSYLGYSSGGTGIVNVDGTGSMWDHPYEVNVGYSGSGTLNITKGGSVDSGVSYLGYFSGSTGVAHIDGSGSTWTGGMLHVGLIGTGTLNITGGATVISYGGPVGCQSGSTGVVNVNGVGSSWTNRLQPNHGSDAAVGRYGNGTLNITGGGAVSTDVGRLGLYSGSTGVARVDGTGSTWTNDYLYVGDSGNGTLDVSNSGLVSVGTTLTIDNDGDRDSFINMSTGGMLALRGHADGSLAQFLNLVQGTDAICYWNGSSHAWTSITGATPGTDYTLAYVNNPSSKLHGFTVLTVLTVPEPGTILLLVIGATTLLMRRRGLA